jgi:hypothetical protein
VLSLQESWSSDRGLLSVLDSHTSLGTILIWLSRSLEAVSESVDDLTFAMDSVYVDAAQRQVVELRFASLPPFTVPGLPLRKQTTEPITFGQHEPPILLSDLLDWVIRASRDEGPRIVQDAGKDGVLAFFPVLNRLRILIHATREAIHNQHTLPHGLRTPRVRRALHVLAGQLDEAADLARLVRRDVAPQVSTVVSAGVNSDTKRFEVQVTGTNFRQSASAVLFAQNRDDIPELFAPHIQVQQPHSATASFRNPHGMPGGGSLTWLLVITNPDGAQSDPVVIQI